MHRRQLWRLRWQSSLARGRLCLCKGFVLLLQARTPHPRVAAPRFQKRKTKFVGRSITTCSAVCHVIHNGNLQSGHQFQEIKASPIAATKVFPKIGSSMLKPKAHQNHKSFDFSDFRLSRKILGGMQVLLVKHSCGTVFEFLGGWKPGAGSIFSSSDPKLRLCPGAFEFLGWWKPWAGSTCLSSEPNFRLRKLGEALGGSHIFRPRA